MTGVEVRKLSDEEIQVETKRLRTRLVTLRTQVVTEKVEDTSEFRKVRKDIARMLTEAKARSAKGK
jgi:large subunit ribosomal protein L29